DAQNPAKLLKPAGFLLTFASTVVKVLTIWLMFVYAFSATGASVHLHYCCGKLQHLAMENKQTANRDDCKLCVDHHGKKDHPNCDSRQHGDPSVQPHDHCHDIQVDAQKTTGDHLPSGDKNVLKIPSLDLLVVTLIHVAGFPLHSFIVAETANAPPLVAATPLFIRHCTYRI